MLLALVSKSRGSIVPTGTVCFIQTIKAERKAPCVLSDKEEMEEKDIRVLSVLQILVSSLSRQQEISPPVTRSLG